MKAKIVTGMLVAVTGCGEVLMDSPLINAGQATAQAVREKTYDKMSAALFKGWDRNRDGVVVSGEYQPGSSFPTTPFETIDSNGDGALSLEEVSESVGEEARVFFAEAHRGMFTQADRNQNDQIEPEELKGFRRASGQNFMTTASLKRYDVDRNGRLSFAEFETYAIEKAIKTYVPKIS